MLIMTRVAKWCALILTLRNCCPVYQIGKGGTAQAIVTDLHSTPGRSIKKAIHDDGVAKSAVARAD